MFCRYCGKEIDRQAIYCPQCGKKLSRNTSSERTHISNDWEYKHEDSKTAEDEAFIFNQSKNEQNKKLKFMDYISLYFLSLRGFFWRIDGRDYRYVARSMFPFGWILRLIIYVLMAWPFLTIVDLVVELRYPVIYSTDMTFGAIVGTVIGLIIGFIITTFVLICLDFNLQRLVYNLRFQKSAWWKNTGIGPNAIRKDKSKGLYGEYIATMAIENNMRKYHLTGEIFNNVIVPKKDGSFTELDAILVSNAGIFVFEAKAKSGTFTGHVTDKKWLQTLGNEEYEEESPLYQNWQHCNFLNEYIYEHLPEGAMKENGISDKIIPVVLFAMPGVVLDISGTTRGLAYSCCNAMNGKNSFMSLDIKDFFEVDLSAEERHVLCSIIDKIAHIPQQERKVLMSERHAAEERGEFFHGYQYFVAMVWLPSDRASYYACCRTDGYYTMVYNPSGVFLSFPEMQIRASGRKYKTFDQAMQEKRRLDVSPDDEELFDSIFGGM